MNLKKHLDKIKKDGYTVVNNVINEDQCNFYKALLEEDYKKYSPIYAGKNILSKHSLDNKKGEKVVYNLHNKNLKWFDLFQNEIILKLLDLTLVLLCEQLACVLAA